MRFVADLHFHSKYSRAVSKDMVLPVIAEYAKKKGLDILTTGDFTHPLWFREIRSQLEEYSEGIYKLKSRIISTSEESRGHLRGALQPKETLFILTTEISSIYSQGGKTRRIHNLVFAPGFETVEKINQELFKRGCNLTSDGRPIIGLSSQYLLELLLSIDEKIILIPCHAWTPWFSLYGSMSGFDSIEECFGEYSKYIYAIETGLSCYDEETEILTESGWKRFPRVTYSDNICTLNLDTEEIEYQKPQNIYKHKYRGKMYHLKTRRVDLLVTPNHNLVYAPADFHTRRKYRLKEAELLFGKSKILRKDGIWKGKKLQYFILPEVRVPHGSRFYSGFRIKPAKKLSAETWLKFFGFWIAEGWTNKGKNGDYNVCLAVLKPETRKEMLQILEELGYNSYYDGKFIRVRDYQMFSYLRQFGKAIDKHVPVEVKNFSKNLLEIFLEYYLKGDGHIYGRAGRGRSATTISVRLRDDLQEIALKIGISAYYKLHQRKGTPFSSPSGKKEYKQNADSWNIYFIRHNRHNIIPSEMKKYGHKEEWIEYNGMVYCVSVSNRVVYIRRNGIPLWCGNSDPEMNWKIKELENRSIVSFSDAHSPAKMGREATVFELQEVSYENVRKAIMQLSVFGSQLSDSGQSVVGQSVTDKQTTDKLISENRKQKTENRISFTIEFYPEEGKYHYTGHRNCKVVQSPQDTKTRGVFCPVCKRPLTVGVMHRVEELAHNNRHAEFISASQEIPKQVRDDEQSVFKIDKYGVKWIGDPSGKHPPYVKLVPLLEIIAESLDLGLSSIKVKSVFDDLCFKFGSEIDVLLKTDIQEIEKFGIAKIAEGVKKVRGGDIAISPGFDGEYGKVKIWASDLKVKKDTPQLALDF